MFLYVANNLLVVFHLLQGINQLDVDNLTAVASL